MKYSDLGHALNRIMKIMSIHECKWPGSLVVRWQHTDQTYLGRKLEKTVFIIVKLHLFFKIVLVVYVISW